MTLPELGLDIPGLLGAYYDNLIPLMIVIAGAHAAFTMISKAMSWGKMI